MNFPPIALSAIVLIVTFVAVILLDAYGKRRHIKAASIAGFALALLVAAIPGSSATLGLVRIDAFTYVFTLLFLGVGLLVTLASHEATAVYNGSVILSSIGMMLVAGANDLILLYVSIELVTSPTYVLVAYHKTQQRMEATVKYFIVGIVASALLLLGLALIVSSSGTSSIGAISFSTQPLFLLGIAAFLAGLGFKLGMFPFNFWIPDVYQGAPSEVAGLLAGASKKAAYAALLRVAVVIALLHSWGVIFAVLAALTMTVANVIALLQQNARRLLAYSIMSQAGFLLMGVAVASRLGYSATIFHSFTHAFMALGAFLVLGVFFSHKIETLDQLKGLGWRNPFLGASLSIFLLSLAGIPLLSGFASKFYLIYAAVDGGMVWLAVLAVLNSVVALYYYFRVIRAMYAYPGGGNAFHLRATTYVAIAVCVVLTVLIGVWPQPFIELATNAANALF